MSVVASEGAVLPDTLKRGGVQRASLSIVSWSSRGESQKSRDAVSAASFVSRGVDGNYSALQRCKKEQSE